MATWHCQTSDWTLRKQIYSRPKGEMFKEIALQCTLHERSEIHWVSARGSHICRHSERSGLNSLVTYIVWIQFILGHQCNYF